MIVFLQNTGLLLMQFFPVVRSNVYVMFTRCVGLELIYFLRLVFSDSTGTGVVIVINGDLLS